MKTCGIGQAKPCGKPAGQIVAVYELYEHIADPKPGDGGVLFMCEYHATTPVFQWETPKS